MITVYTITYNEELLMQFMIDHWRNRFPGCHIVIYDNKSTDKTVEIALANNCEVRGYESNNTLNDGVHMHIKNTCWMDAKTDWVVVCDLDELLEIDQAELLNEESNGTTIINTEGWSMVNLNDDYDFKSMRHGHPDVRYNKRIMFNKKHISHINYGAGAHDCSPIGNVKYSSKIYTLHHYIFINPDKTVAKSLLTAKRLSQANLQNNWGHQCKRTEAEIREEFSSRRHWAILAPARRQYD
jgi:glycosyltransferase involved in cell wall biosynthesis